MKKILVTGSALALILLASGYLTNPAEKAKNNTVWAADTLQLKKEVINLTTDNILGTNNAASPGHHLRYRLTFSNPGNSDVKNATLIDVLPNGTTFVAVTENGVYSAPDNSVSWALANVASGGTGVVNYEVTVNSVPDQTIIDNTAFISAPTFPQGFTSNDVKTTVSAPQLVLGLAVDKARANRRDRITYTINLQNTGSLDAQSVKVTDVLPNEAAFVDSNVTPSGIDNNLIEFNLGSIAKGGAQTITLSATINTTAPVDSTIVNNVIINFSDKANGSYPTASKSVATAIGAAPVPKTPSKAPKTGGESIPALAISLFIGLAITVFFYYNHEPLSFASAKVSVWQSKIRMTKLHSRYASKSAWRLRLERLKIKIRKMANKI